MSKGIETEIRRARPADAVFDMRPDEHRYIEKAIAAGHCFAAVLDGRPVGYAVLQYTFYDNGFISELLVDGSYRRRGIGSSLMARLEAECQTTKLFTSTNLSNLPMQSLRNQRGYKLTGFIENLDPGDPELVYFMIISDDES